MSFGTGHNETTQLVLELMSDYLKGDEDKMLDFGCGTGILTIAGIKLGVQRNILKLIQYQIKLKFTTKISQG